MSEFTMKWFFHYDEGRWSASSCYHDEGLPFQWRIGVCEDGTFCVSDSDPELTTCKETLASLIEAKVFCESIEQQIRSPGSYCDLSLPLDAAEEKIQRLENELVVLRAELKKARGEE